MKRMIKSGIAMLICILMLSSVACTPISDLVEILQKEDTGTEVVSSETDSSEAGASEIVSEPTSEAQSGSSMTSSQEPGSETIPTGNTSEEPVTTEEPGASEQAAKVSGTPYELHGALRVEGTNIVDANGEPYQIAGVSTHGLAWFPDYVNKDAFLSIRDDWGANTIRLAMYTAENGGYCEGGDKEQLKALVKDGVNYATDLGMYVIVDWHILHDLDPNKYKSDSIAFFDEMSREFKDQDNVIYEICNEPNGGTSWSAVKSYALEVIPVIRANDPDAIIIVGTPNWCQFVDDAAKDPITEYDNIVYAVHFYAETHRDDIRNRMTTAINQGLPVIISEFSICDASGNGTNNIEQANIWIDLLDQHNVGFVAWNLSNKAESSSIISSGCQKTSGWTYDELSESGKWLVGVLNEHSDQGAGLLDGQTPVTSGNASNSGGSTDNQNTNNGGNNQQTSFPAGIGSADDLYVTVTAANSWESGGKHCTQLNINIENQGASAVSGWTLEIDLGQSVSIDQIWCAFGNADGNKIIITPESYNERIPGGQSVSDIGVIVSTSGSVSTPTVTVK